MTKHHHKKTVLILAAGLGSRLNPSSLTCHKTLSLVAGKPLLLHQIENLIRFGILEENIYIAVGYLAASIKQAVHASFPAIHFVENSDYKSTNNMVSLYLISQEMSVKNYDDFYVINGDNLYEDRMIEHILACKTPSFLAYSAAKYNDENMKIKSNISGHPVLMGKDISKSDSVGLSNDCFKITQENFIKLIEIMADFIHVKNIKNIWMEYAFIELFKTVPFSLLDCSAYKWIEIDTKEDLIKAEKLFSYATLL